LPCEDRARDVDLLLSRATDRDLGRAFKDPTVDYVIRARAYHPDRTTVCDFIRAVAGVSERPYPADLALHTDQHKNKNQYSLAALGVEVVEMSTSRTDNVVAMSQMMQLKSIVREQIFQADYWTLTVSCPDC
jgi:hypothetical protein